MGIFNDRDVYGVERFVADFASVELLEQIRQIVRDEINDTDVERLFARNGSASRTEEMAQSALRCRLSAMDLANMAVSFSIFVFIVSSVFSTLPLAPISTGCAAPMRVCGAIAATSAAMVMNTPALPARAGAGATKNHGRHLRVVKFLDDLRG